MTESGIVTAEILNNLLLNLDLLIEGNDIYLSMEEFALGLPEGNRDLDLCWGYAKIEPSTATLAQHEITIGKGITRNISGSLNKITHNFTSIDLTNLLPNSQSFADVYAFGSIFITLNPIFGESPSIEPVILKGTALGSPLLMTRELDLETITNMIKNNEVQAAIKPESNSLEIFKFLININFYNSDNPELKDVEIFIFDKRLPRGWGGYADEDLFTNLASYLIFKKEDYSAYLLSIEEYIYNIIKNWINLRSWSPSFIDYWNANASSMPDRLKIYLNNEFSLAF